MSQEVVEHHGIRDVNSYSIWKYAYNLLMAKGDWKKRKFVDSWKRSIHQQGFQNFCLHEKRKITFTILGYIHDHTVHNWNFSLLQWMTSQWTISWTSIAFLMVLLIVRNQLGAPFMPCQGTVTVLRFHQNCNPEVEMFTWKTWRMVAAI